MSSVRSCPGIEHAALHSLRMSSTECVSSATTLVRDTDMTLASASGVLRSWPSGMVSTPATTGASTSLPRSPLLFHVFPPNHVRC
eukprot:1331117-Rhodomonas_salina.3